VLVAAVLWWQRGASTPLPEPTNAPAEQAVSDTPQPPASVAAPDMPAVQPLHPRTTPTPGPAPQEQQSLPAAAEPAASPPPEAPAPQAETTAPAPPPVARPARPPRQNAAPAAERSPESVCAESSGGVPRALCIGVQCFKSEFRRHPTCVRLENEVRERRQREIDQGLVGG
jgi:hypothetical protein